MIELASQQVCLRIRDFNLTVQSKDQSTNAGVLERGALQHCGILHCWRKCNLEIRTGLSCRKNGLGDLIAQVLAQRSGAQRFSHHAGSVDATERCRDLQCVGLLHRRGQLNLDRAIAFHQFVRGLLTKHPRTGPTLKMQLHYDQARWSRRGEHRPPNRDPLPATLRRVELVPQQFGYILLQVRQIGGQLKCECALRAVHPDLRKRAGNRHADRPICNVDRMIHRWKGKSQILAGDQGDAHFPSERELLVVEIR